MASSCVLRPRVKTKDEHLEYSRLFDAIIDYTGKKDRNSAVQMYGYFKSDEFRKKYKNRIRYDESQDEPLFEDILNVVTLKDRIDDTKTSLHYMKSIDEIDSENKVRTVPDTTENFNSLCEKCVKFNQQNNGFTATVNQTSGMLNVNITRSNDETTDKAKRLASSYHLNRKIREILSRAGVSIAHLENLQDRLHSNGVLDYDNAKVTAEGFISLVRLAEGYRGEQALPEEFSHFIVDAMQDDSMVTRLLNLSANEDIQKEILGEQYDEYRNMYSDEQMQREVAGKIVARNLENNYAPRNYSSVISRIASSVKNFIRKIFNAKDISDAIAEADLLAGQIATRVFDNGVRKITAKDLTGKTNLHQLAEHAHHSSQIISQSLRNISKEYAVYEAKLRRRYNKAETDDEKKKAQDALDAYSTKMESILANIQMNLFNNHNSAAVEEYVYFAANELEQLNERMVNLNNNWQSMSLKQRAYLLENARNLIHCNKETLDTLVQSLNDSDVDFTLSDEAKERVRVLRECYGNVQQIYNEQAILVFRDFLADYLPQEGIMIEGREKPVTRNELLDLLKTADKDISGIETMLSAISESSDVVLRLAQQAVMKQKEKKRIKRLKIQQELTALAQQLKNEGIEDTEWMFERHSDGSLSSNYVSDINWTKFYDDMHEMLATTKDATMRKLWFQTHKDPVTGYPVASIYGVDIDSIFPQGSAKRQYYDYFMNLRSELIAELPDGLYKNSPTKAIQITKDLWERIKSSSPDEWLAQTMQSAKEGIIPTVDATDYGIRTTFENTELKSVPIFFTKRVKDEQSLSRDTVSTMVAFADMALNYSMMNDILPMFEFGSDIMDEREAYVLKKGKPVKTIPTGQFAEQPAKEKAKNTAKMFQNLVDTQLFGRYLNDGTFTIFGHEIKYNQIAKILNRFSSLNQLAVNGIAGAAQVINDISNIDTEVLTKGKKLFTAKNLKDADAIYLKELGGYLGEMYSPIKTHKLALFNQLFNIQHNDNEYARDLKWDTSTMKKILSSDSLYAFMTMGAHWGETRTALAQAQNITIKSDDGTSEECLWDILEIQYIDDSDHSKGARLVVKDSYTLTEDDIIRYSQKFNSFNRRMFGNYDNMHRNALERTAAGQLVMLYRKFMIPAIQRRYAKKIYNFEMDEYTKGMYRSFFEYITDFCTDSKKLGRSISLYWNSMNDLDRQNCMKAMKELTSFCMFALLAVTLSSWDWDKKNNPWHRKMLTLLAKRAKTEIGVFTPVGMVPEAMNILKSPAAAVNTLENMIDLMGVMNPWNYEGIGGKDALVERGRYKGHNKAYKYFMQSPLVPMNRTVYKFMHPEEAFIAFN